MLSIPKCYTNIMSDNPTQEFLQSLHANLAQAKEDNRAKEEAQRAKLETTIAQTEVVARSLVAFVETEDTHATDLSCINDIWDLQRFSVGTSVYVGGGTEEATGRVIIPERFIGDLDVVFHESLHRSDVLHRKHNGTLSLADQLSTTYTSVAREPMDARVADVREEQQANAQVDAWQEAVADDAQKLREGLAQWCTINAPRIMGTGELKENHLYIDQVTMMDTIRDKLIQQGEAGRKVDAMYVKTALSGNWKELFAHIDPTYLFTLLTSTPPAIPSEYTHLIDKMMY